MGTEFGKIFTRTEGGKEYISIIKYNPEEDYSLYLSKKRNNRYREALLTPDRIANITKALYKKEYFISNIEFEDSALEEETENLITIAAENEEYRKILLRTLEENGEYIRNIQYKNTCRHIYFCLFPNGIISTKKEMFCEIISDVYDILTENKPISVKR